MVWSFVRILIGSVIRASQLFNESLEKILVVIVKCHGGKINLPSRSHHRSSMREQKKTMDKTFYFG